MVLCFYHLVYVTVRTMASLFVISYIVRRKSHIGWNWSTDFFCRLIRVYIGLRQYFSEGVTISSIGIFLNPIWPPPQPNIIKMTITPQVFVVDTYLLVLCPGLSARVIYWKVNWCDLTITFDVKYKMAATTLPISIK